MTGVNIGHKLLYLADVVVPCILIWLVEHPLSYVPDAAAPLVSDHGEAVTGRRSVYAEGERLVEVEVIRLLAARVELPGGETAR